MNEIFRCAGDKKYSGIREEPKPEENREINVLVLPCLPMQPATAGQLSRHQVADKTPIVDSELQLSDTRNKMIQALITLSSAIHLVNNIESSVTYICYIVLRTSTILQLYHDCNID